MLNIRRGDWVVYRLMTRAGTKYRIEQVSWINEYDECITTNGSLLFNHTILRKYSPDDPDLPLEIIRLS